MGGLHDLDQVLDLRLDRFQRWAEEQGEPVPARPAAVLLTLLRLCRAPDLVAVTKSA
jgi:hypothetical protein